MVMACGKARPLPVLVRLAADCNARTGAGVMKVCTMNGTAG